MASQKDFIKNLGDFLADDPDIAEIFGENVFFGKPIEEISGPTINMKTSKVPVGEYYLDYFVDLDCFHPSSSALEEAVLTIRDKLPQLQNSDLGYFNFYPIEISPIIKDPKGEKYLQIFSFGIKVKNVS